MSDITLREHLSKAGKASARKRTSEENMKRVNAMNEARKRKREEKLLNLDVDTNNIW